MDDKQPLLNEQPPTYGAPPPGYGGPPPPSPGFQGPPPGYQVLPPGYVATAPPPPGFRQPPQACHVTVVAQPRPTAIVYERHYGTGDHYLLLSVILSFLCFFCGTWWALVCTIPAIFFAISAQESEARGDLLYAQRSAKMALTLNIAGIITYVVTWVLIVTIVIINISIDSAYYY